MTQSDLARSSGVSLPTIQGIERGAANPTLSTLDGLLAALGLKLGVEESEVDWDLLCALGLPLAHGEPLKIVPSEDLLVPAVRMAALDLQDVTHGRKLDALQALILAVKSHYPTVYRRSFSGSSLVRAIAERPVTGRIVKLQRIARDRLSGYL
jgi:transcriptional regulator with XRE-family HTH domain